MNSTWWYDPVLVLQALRTCPHQTTLWQLCCSGSFLRLSQSLPCHICHGKASAAPLLLARFLNTCQRETALIFCHILLPCPQCRIFLRHSMFSSLHCVFH